MHEPRLPARLQHAARAALVPVAAALLAGACAGSTVGSGVGDRYLDAPPYQAGTRLTVGIPVAHLPVGYQAGATQPASFDPSATAGSPIDALLREMNAYLDSLGATTRVVAPPAVGTPPDVMFGCSDAAGMDCTEPDDVSSPQMRLAVARPSGEWTAWLQQLLDSAGVEHVLLVTLETGEYWPRQRNLLGQKEVRLGTGYTVNVPWLTSLDDPVSVLQLTGAVIGRDGKAVRIGAEGLFANPTHILLSGVGVTDMISDEDVERIRTARRDDLPDRPLVWQAALRNLVAGLVP